MYRALVLIHVNLMPICISHISNFSVKEKEAINLFYSNYFNVFSSNNTEV